MASRTATVLLSTAGAIVAVVVVAALLPAATVSAEEDHLNEDIGYIIYVGDDDGWNLEVNYTEWAQYETFNVGDVLKFEYSAQEHNVVWTSDQASYDACTVSACNTITMNSGDDMAPLRSAGQYFFFSSLNGDCTAGMKLTVHVAPAPSPS